MPNKTIEYILTSPIKISKDGEFVDSDKIIIKEPAYRTLSKANKLFQEFKIAKENSDLTIITKIKDKGVMEQLQSFAETKRQSEKTEKGIDIQQNEGEEDTSIASLSNKEIFDILLKGDADIEKCVNILKEILRETSSINGVQTTETMIQQLKIKDFNNLLAEYIKVFLEDAI